VFVGLSRSNAPGGRSTNKYATSTVMNLRVKFVVLWVMVSDDLKPTRGGQRGVPDIDTLNRQFEVISGYYGNW
jgi:hypothetical protein